MTVRSLGVAILVVCATFATAQTFRGSITGTVTDSTGAAVADATVTATNPAVAFTRTTQTGATGDYNLAELPLGTYDVTVTKSGFKTVTQKGVEVTVAAVAHIDVQLTPGQVQESVEVTAELPLVDTVNNTMGGTLEEKQLQDLPVNGRDFLKFMVMVPGSTADPSGVSDSPGAFGQFSINGNRGRSNNFLLDGTDMNDGYRNDSAVNEAGVFGTPATLLPIEAVSEIGVLNNTEAEYGRNSGATVNIVTKSGTNQWHGSIFEDFRNNWLDARNWFNTKPTTQDEFRNNQFGGSIGGPIIKDKTFFFLAYEGQREIIGIPENITLPSQAQIAAAPAALAALGLGLTPNPIAQNILALNPWGIPYPAVGDLGGADSATVQASNKSTNLLSSLIFKIDQHIGKSDLLTGRYFYGTSQQSFPLALVGGGITPGFNTNTPTDVSVLSISYTHVFSPKFLMELRGGWNSFDEDFTPQDGKFNPASVGLNTVTNPQDFGLPFLNISGLSPLGANVSLPRGRVDVNWHLLDNFSWTSGRHNIKYGVEFRRTTVEQFFDAGYRGKFNFDGSTTGDPFLDFFAGVPSSGRAAQGNSERHTHQNNISFYAQDSFHWTRNFTLNLGLRWDYFGVIGENDGQFSIFDPTIPGPKLVSQLYPKDYNNFAPRVAFAWDVFGTGKTVVRAGWGIYYDAFSQDFFIGQLPFNTFNPGPAYNGVGPNPITFTFSTPNMTPVACGTPGSIPIPNSALCAPVAFTGFSAADVFTVDQGIRTPYVQNYNLNVEQQIGTHTSLIVSYVGSAGRKLFRYRDINQCSVVTPGTGGTCFPDPGVNNELVSPFGAAGFEYINQFESTATSSYNALQVTFNVRSWHRFDSVVNYTWGHSLDNASDGQDFVAQATQPDNSFNPKAERGNSNFDTRNRFNWRFHYDFPNSSSMSWLLSGWGTDGVLTLMDGQPYNLTYQFEGDFNGSGEFFGRPDLVPGVNPFTGTGNFNLINLGAFAAPCTWDNVAGACVPGTEHFGNVGRNAFRGPSFKNFDWSIVKNTRLGERVTMQLRADFFNVFNHPNFTNPSLPFFAVDFLGNGSGFVPTVNATTGLLTGTGFLNPTATPDNGIGNPFLGGGGPRNIQLGIRFSF